MQVQKLLKVAGTLDIRKICSLHGPVLTENLSHYIEKYDIWSSYRPEEEGVVVAYTSVYGNTKKAAELLADKLKEKALFMASLAISSLYSITKVCIGIRS